MSNEQKPSVESIQRYRLIGHDSDLEADPEGDVVRLVDLPDLLARVRREARAEAFEEGAMRANATAVHGTGEHDADEIANELRALAAKERAK